MDLSFNFCIHHQLLLTYLGTPLVAHHPMIGYCGFVGYFGMGGDHLVVVVVEVYLVVVKVPVVSWEDQMVVVGGVRM